MEELPYKKEAGADIKEEIKILEDKNFICIVTLSMIILSGCGTEREEPPAVSVKTESNEMLLPKKNLEPRTEAVTHVMLHFSSNVDDPYKLEDIYTTYKEYGGSAHYVIDRSGGINMFIPEDRIASKNYIRSFIMVDKTAQDKGKLQRTQSYTKQGNYPINN